MCVCVDVCVCVCVHICMQHNAMVTVLLYLHNRGVRVERDSVNSVTIDNEPQDKHERIMIASHVGLNPSGNTMVLRCVYELHYYIQYTIHCHYHCSIGIPP